MKRAIIICSLLVLTGIVTAITCYSIVKFSVAERIYNKVEDIPYNKVALLLGTAPVTPYGGHNRYFDYRIDATASLYKSGKISYILVSGDNHKKGYDEPTWMKEALMKQGVPENAIILDYAGFRTLDSVVRSKEIFGQEKITIISQEFHNERAVYLAEHYGIDAVAFNAKDVELLRKKLKIAIFREALSRVKMFIDIATGKKPKFLGEKIEIG
ncbi:MAG: YdcF family protein [Bacteroidaceae bacterium]|nr:YdcF family protein [Bacteroidaceae bacterium]